ncbi:MAG: hypothetical protein QOJ07_1860 [Thermoleophilaceae bacterium]|nr:hypothetical protein [Thermoleophilaceae bacterium]
MGRRRVAVAVLVLVLSAVAPGAADAKWSKLSPDDVSLTGEPDYGHLTGSEVGAVVAWPAARGASVAQAVEVRGFTPTVADPTGAESRLGTPVSGWNAIGDSPVLTGFVDSPGDPAAHDPGASVLFTGFDHHGDGQGGTFLAGPVQPPGGEVPYSVLAAPRSGDLDAVSVFDGSKAGVVWANNASGTLSTYRDTRAPAPGEADLQAQLGGCCAYHPSLAVGPDGKVWLNWYSNSSANTGLFMVPLDPATGAAAGPTLKVPGSETVANNFQRLPMACRVTCRIFYATQPDPAGPVKLSSWAPGDQAPTTIPGADNLTLNAVIGAAIYPAANDTWVAWYDRGKNGSPGGYRAVTGDDRGVSDKVFDLGVPSGAVAFGQLQAVAFGDNLMLIGVAGSGGASGGAVWIEMATSTGDPTIPMTDGFAKPRIARAGSAIAVVSGVQSGRKLRQRGLLAELQSSEPGKVGLKVCVNRVGHPPSPCRQASTAFRRAGVKAVHVSLGRSIAAQGSLRVTLTAGGKSASLTLKPRR